MRTEGAAPGPSGVLAGQSLSQLPLAGQKRNRFVIDAKTFASAAARESIRNESM